MEIYNMNLNIHYSAPQEVWDKLERLYREDSLTGTTL
ncbi:hypothetical protein LSPH24S_08771 [Lysinibacillus sphaericus]